MDKIIKTADEHAVAFARLSRLMDADLTPGSPESDEFELLALLVEAYEKKHNDLGLPDPVTAIKFRMEQQGLSRKDMIPYFGSASRVSEVLNGKRPLTLAMIRRLHRELGIPAEALLNEPVPKPATALARRSPSLARSSRTGPKVRPAKPGVPVGSVK